MVSEIARKRGYVRQSRPKGTTKATDRAFYRIRLLVTPTPYNYAWAALTTGIFRSVVRLQFAHVWSFEILCGQASVKHSKFGGRWCACVKQYSKGPHGQRTWKSRYSTHRLASYTLCFIFLQVTYSNAGHKALLLNAQTFSRLRWMWCLWSEQ